MPRLKGLLRRPGAAIAAGVWCFTICASGAYGQPRQEMVQDNPWFARVSFAPSYVLPTSDFLSGANAAGRPLRWSPGTTVELGRQTDGSQLWHQFYNLPSYGVGFSAAGFGDERELGQPLEAYVFFSWPIVRLAERVELTTDFSTGLSWHWRPYDEVSNPYNRVIGSDVNGRFDWGFYARYIATPRVSVYAGVEFIHRSNGELLQPNDGINVIGPRVGLRYNLGAQRREPVHVVLPPLPSFHPSWELVVGLTGSQRNVLGQLHPLTRSNFHGATLATAAQWHFYRYGKAAAGIDLTYDGATGARIDPSSTQFTRADVAARWSLGVYGGYEHIITRFSVIAQVGYAAVRASGTTPWYERYGWRYRITDRLSATAGMRLIDVFNATQLEFGAAYRLR